MSHPIGIGEQWMPIPVRLVKAIETAPTARRRLWAVAYLVIWALTFYRSRSGDECSLRDLQAWSATNTRTRTMKAKKDALEALSQWSGEQQTAFGPPMDHQQTTGDQVQPPASGPNRPPTDHQQTDRARLPSTITNYNSTKTEHEIEPVRDLTVIEGDLSWTAATTRQAFEAAWSASRPDTRYAAARQENDRATELAKLLTTAGWSSDQLSWRIADYLDAHAAGQAFPKPNAEGPQRTGLPQFLSVVRRELTPAPRLVVDTPKPHSTGRHIIPTALDLADIAAAEEWLKRQEAANA